MAMVPNGVETMPKISIAWVGRTNVTDRQTTDGQATTYSEREREFNVNVFTSAKKINSILLNIKINRPKLHTNCPQIRKISQKYT